MRTILEIFFEEREEEKGLKISLKKISRNKNGGRNNIRIYSLRKCRSKLGSSVFRYEILVHSTDVMEIPLQDTAHCVVYSRCLEAYCASCVRCRQERRCIQLSSHDFHFRSRHQQMLLIVHCVSIIYLFITDCFSANIKFLDSIHVTASFVVV
jgi:hypothetical protein